jgi:hypothetical protein
MEHTITQLLAKLGHHPVRKSGKEHIYHSPLRDHDHTPSFTVDDTLGVYYDHGTGKGGDYNHLAVQLGQQKAAKRPRKNFAVKLPNYLVEQVTDIGHNPETIQYLTQRGLWKQRHKLKEVHYYVQDEKKNCKHFSATGWQNDHGAWEVRNKYFKGCLGKKGITTLQGCPERLCLFDSYLDYLSWQHDNPNDNPTIIVLNSINHLSNALKTISTHVTITTYFDHNCPGRAATKQVLQTIPTATDGSTIYKGFNDYNDYRAAVFQVHKS